MSSILTIQFPSDFERRYKKYRAKLLRKSAIGTEQNSIRESVDKDVLQIKLKSGFLAAKQNTGYIKLNNTESQLNPQSQEFKVLIKLMTNEDCQATYADLLGKEPTKDNKRGLSFVLRNLKGNLGILPKKGSFNKDIFRNVKNYGYGLIV